MDTIIEFLEQYWGVSLFGGVSLGTIITFTVTQIKIILKEKSKSKNLDCALELATNLCTELDNRNKDNELKLANMAAENKKMQNEIAEREAYFEKVQAATFQAISYLVIASKLPTEDKIALQEKFSNLTKTKVSEYKEVVEKHVNDVEEGIIPDMKETINDTVEETKSLLDKYTKEG